MANRPEIDAVLQGVEAWNKWRGRNAGIRAPDLSGVDLSGMNFSKAWFYQVSFVEANLSEAKLSEANFEHANLYKANLSEADLRGADLSGANLARANLSETTNLTQKQIEEATGNKQTKLPEHLNPPAPWSQVGRWD